MPEVLPPVLKFVPAQERAFVEDQVRVEVLPWNIEVGLTEMLAVVITLETVTLTVGAV